MQRRGSGVRNHDVCGGACRSLSCRNCYRSGRNNDGWCQRNSHSCECKGLGAGGRIVGNLQGGLTNTRGAWRECYTHRACCVGGYSCTLTSIGSECEVAGVRSGKRNGGDIEGSIAIVSDGYNDWSASSALRGARQQ